MGYNKNILIEGEKEQILSLYGLNNNSTKNNKYLFDFVITENNNFIIFMDNVISKKHGFIGDLWENTWVFNEIIKENLEKSNSLLIEYYTDGVDNLLKQINWSKEFVSECILNIDTLNESLNIDEQFFDKLKSAASNIASDVVSGVKKVGSKIGDFASKLISGPILGTLRWIRRNAYTSIGMVVDVLTAMLPATTGLNKAAWGFIVLLDLYEIIKGDFDPEDEERNAEPYMYLVIDLIAWFFSAAFGQTAKTAIKGTAKLPSQTVKILGSLLEKLPTLKNLLKTFSEWLVKKLPNISKIFNSVLSGIDRVILGVENFISQLLSKRGAVAAATGASVAWFFEPRNLKIGNSGDDVLSVNKYFTDYHNMMWPDCQVKQDVINSLKNDGNKFTKNTEVSVKTFESCLSKHPEFKSVIKNVDGQVTNYELSLYGDVKMDDRGVFSKLIPHSTKEKFNKVVGGVMQNLSKSVEKSLSPIAAK